jgi:mannose-6-phosphate isomerase-like protein (cupin superfamily)
MNIKYDKRPWGEEEILTMNEPSTVKILTVASDKRCSLQYHQKRTEFWKIIEGEAILEIDNKNIEAKKDDEFEILPGTRHRITGKNGNCKILEVSFGDFDENDIIRIEDDYGRIKQ